MAQSIVDDAALRSEIQGLAALSLEQLRERWRELYGTKAPQGFRREMLIRALAYQLQVRAYGGLSTGARRKLREIAAAARDGRLDAIAAESRIKPGTRLIRVWQDKTHSVLVLEDGGFEWNGARHRSLSTIAKTITGTSWNGWTFFGVKRGSVTKGRDSLGRFRTPAPGQAGSKHWPRSRARSAEVADG